MKKAITEKNFVIILFIAVLIIFSMAERDSKKITRLYVAVVQIDTKAGLVKAKPALSATVVPAN